MAKNAHLVLDERATIEVRIRERASFTEIGRELGKDPSTISKEVRLHSQTVRKDSFNPCSNLSRISPPLMKLNNWCADWLFSFFLLYELI